jgi:thiol-disulfide isomerase/thioredoxin
MNRFLKHARWVVIGLLVLLTGCGSETDGKSLAGEWRAILRSSGGELPFTLLIEERDGRLYAYALNGTERAPFSDVQINGHQVEMAFAWYDAEIRADVESDGQVLTGRWRKTAADGNSVLGFRAERGAGQSRFKPLQLTKLEPGAQRALPDVSGEWAAEFTDEDGSEPAQGEFRQDGKHVSGTFLTPTGDYRFLEGSFEDGVLRLSTFDGAHAFLFVARADENGELTGDFWSRDSYHATWVAHRRVEGEEVVPDGWTLVGVNNDEARFTFAFDDLNGERVTQGDPRFEGKVVVVNLFGSWCPNCNDEAPLLAEWYREFRDSGLEIVGLAFEYTGDVERDRRQMARYADRHGIEYTLLLGGTSDKTDAAANLPDVDRVIAYPTTVFIGRDGTVRKIYSGFSGPGTGEHYEQLKADFEELIKTLLKEQV